MTTTPLETQSSPLDTLAGKGPAAPAKREECDEEAKEAWLEQALEEGFSSGVAQGDVMGRIRARYGLSAR